MANLHKGEVEFQVGGKTYILQFSLAALVKLERAMNKGVVKIMREMENWTKQPEEMRLEHVALIIWAGLQKHHPGLSPDDAIELLGEVEGGMNTVYALMGEAFERGFAASETKGTNPTQKTTNGTGMPSGSITSASDTNPTASGTSLPANTNS